MKRKTQVEGSALDSATIAKLYRKLGSYRGVRDHLEKCGVRNPITGQPYTSSTIMRHVRAAGIGPRATRQAVEETAAALKDAARQAGVTRSRRPS